MPERNADGDGLATPTFWDGRAQVGRLRSLHVAAMFAHDRRGAAVRPAAPRPPGRRVRRASISAACRGHSGRHRRGSRLRRRRHHRAGRDAACCCRPWSTGCPSRARPAVTAKGLRSLALLLTALTLAYARGAPGRRGRPPARCPATPARSPSCSPPRPPSSRLLMLVVLFQRHRAKGALLAGFGTPVIASLGLGLGAAFSAGASYRVADYLDGNAVPSPADFGAAAGDAAACSRRCSTSGRPSASSSGAGGAARAAVGEVRDQAAAGPPGPADTDDDYPGGRAARPGRAERVDEAIANARLTDHCPGVRRRLVRGGRGRRGGHHVRPARHRPGAAWPTPARSPPAQCPLWPMPART